MVARNLTPAVSRSNTARRRRSEPDSLRLFAQVATIRWPDATDFGGRPLRPAPQLSATLSGLSCYHNLHASGRELSNAMRRAVPNEVAERVHDAVGDLHRHNLDLYWCIEGQDPDEGRIAPPANRLAAALAIDPLQ
jgi:hypothetical protein